MAGSGPIVNVNILADTKKFSSAMKKAGDDTDVLSKAVKGFGVAAAAAFAAASTAAVALGVSSIKAGSDLQQSIGASQTVFKDYSLEISKFANNAADSVGLSENSYRQLANTIGSMLKNTGTPMDKLASKTNDLITLSADLAATFGGPVEEAASAVSAALRGEADPIERYGISLKATAIEAEALAMTGKSVASTLTDQEKAAARVSLMFKQAKDSTGQFARESNTLAGQQERLKAQFENIKATIGMALIPALMAVLPVFNDFLKKLVASPEFEAFLDTLSESFTGLLEAIAPILPDLGKLILELMPVLMDIFKLAVPVISEVAKAFVPIAQTAGKIVETIFPPLIRLVGEVFKAFGGNNGFADDMTNGLNSAAKAAEYFARGINDIANGVKGLNDLYNAIPSELRFLLFTNPFSKEGLLSKLYGGVSGTGARNVGGGIDMDGDPTTPFARGGIVMPRPGGVKALLAERGQPEAVIPLNKLEKMIGSGSSGVNITVQGNVGWSVEDMADAIFRKQRQAMALAGLNGIVGVR